MYCVKYSNRVLDAFGRDCKVNSVGFIKPWNAVRDSETYSLTYLPPSMINGIEQHLGLPIDSVKRHKITFSKNGMSSEQVKTTNGTYWENGEEFNHNIGTKEERVESGIHKIHQLIDPEIIFGFESKEHAEIAYNDMIYVGRSEYALYPNADFGIVEMTDAEFDELEGVETFQTDDEYAVFCGFNRAKNDEKQYVNIVRKEW